MVELKIRRKKKLKQGRGLAVILLFTLWLLSITLKTEYISFIYLIISTSILSVIVFETYKYLKNQKKEEPIALIIDQKGITDFQAFEKLGLIPWEDIEFVGIKNNILSSYLIVKLKNPMEFIGKIQNDFQLKKQLRLNNAKFQTPIVININTLDIKPNRLIQFIKQNWRNNLVRTQLQEKEYQKIPQPATINFQQKNVL